MLAALKWFRKKNIIQKCTDKHTNTDYEKKLSQIW